MNQKERRIFLITELLKEHPEESQFRIPDDEYEQKQLLRSLMNIRMPREATDRFLAIQDEYLQNENASRGITKLSDLKPYKPELYLWRGDITTLECDAIVNAANSGMTGCYQPCHNCIDNCIHTFSGIQLRNYCDSMMQKQGHEEPVGTAKITPSFNLPCKYVIHTVGPIVHGRLREEHCNQLKACYLSCLETANDNRVRSIAFCCISTGVFMFPADKAAEIAVRTVEEYKKKTGSRIEVIFNVFSEQDERIYEKLC